MIILTGKGGQVASALENFFKEKSVEYKAFSRSELDITNPESIKKILTDLPVSAIINCAAYTAVDSAETEESLAHKVNVVGPQLLAKAVKGLNCFLIHYSTDFIFGSPNEEGRPLRVNDTKNPQSVYAKTKLLGEEEIEENLELGSYAIIRTSWVYSPIGKNFVKTMLQLAQSDRNELTIIEDQIGRPTSAASLAQFTYHLLEAKKDKKKIEPIYHYSNSGIASWYDFAYEIIFQSLSLGLIASNIQLRPIPTEDYPTPAKRPHYSVLDLQTAYTLVKSIPHWKEELQNCLEQIKNES